MTGRDGEPHPPFSRRVLGGWRRLVLDHAGARSVLSGVGSDRPFRRSGRLGTVPGVKVCVVGSGGREHVLAHVLARTADEVVVTPGNPGIPGSTDHPPEAIEADLYVIGPEAPLVDGLADRLRSRGARVFGPGADGARLEGSKAWMKEVLGRAGVPTAAHRSFTAQEREPSHVFESSSVSTHPPAPAPASVRPHPSSAHPVPSLQWPSFGVVPQGSDVSGIVSCVYASASEQSLASPIHEQAEHRSVTVE